MILTTPSTSWQWSHTGFAFLWLVCFTWHNIPKVHLCCFMPILNWVVFKLLDFRSSLYFLGINPFSDTQFPSYFLSFCGMPFHSVHSLLMYEICQFSWSPICLFCPLLPVPLVSFPRIDCQIQCWEALSCVFFYYFRSYLQVLDAFWILCMVC